MQLDTKALSDDMSVAAAGTDNAAAKANAARMYLVIFPPSRPVTADVEEARANSRSGRRLPPQRS
ncbi:hypothetical protein GCM10008942_35560 [Rhizomicrobium electricum]|uniref:Uncharacterized protein n=1 Tax=Rhizomicrobium electricum TaxID=480070 RepID=A0ABP3Q9S1_9PROT